MYWTPSKDEQRNAETSLHVPHHLPSNPLFLEAHLRRFSRFSALFSSGSVQHRDELVHSNALAVFAPKDNVSHAWNEALMPPDELRCETYRFAFIERS